MKPAEADQPAWAASEVKKSTKKSSDDKDTAAHPDLPQPPLVSFQDLVQGPPAPPVAVPGNMSLLDSGCLLGHTH